MGQRHPVSPGGEETSLPDQALRVSLRLANKSVSALTANPAERRKLKKFFDDNDMYLYTANAFPYGSFKGERVKEQVYEPDWRSDDRATYTMRVADILAEIAPAGVNLRSRRRRSASSRASPGRTSSRLTMLR